MKAVSVTFTVAAGIAPARTAKRPGCWLVQCAPGPQRQVVL